MIRTRNIGALKDCRLFRCVEGFASPDPRKIVSHIASRERFMAARLQKLLNSTDGLGTLVLLGLGALFALGTVIVNLKFGTMGLTDFAGLRPRFVLVGLTFLIYLLIPPACCVLLLSIGAMASVRRHPALAASVVLATALTLVFMIPGMLYFTVPFLTFGSPDGIQAPLSFWELYLGHRYALLIEIVLLCLPVSLLHYRLSLKPKSSISASMVQWMPNGRLIIMILIGTTIMLYPYSTVTYLNISRAAGGGQPPIVLMTMEREIGRVLERPGLWRVSTRSDTVYGPFLLWHETDAKTFLTLPRQGSRTPGDVFAIPNEKVRVTWYLPGSVHIRPRFWGAGTMTVKIGWPDDDAGVGSRAAE
jgi:hypothetical protein